MMNPKRIDMDDRGDCFEAAGKLMMDLSMAGEDMSDVRLVHGEVIGEGPVEGIKFGHAWVEKLNELPEGFGKMEWVLDYSNGGKTEMPKALYYCLGKIAANTHHYTYPEMSSKCTEVENWGPWDLETESGL